jgi:hypothetical protein
MSLNVRPPLVAASFQVRSDLENDPALIDLLKELGLRPHRSTQ